MSLLVASANTVIELLICIPLLHELQLLREVLSIGQFLSSTVSDLLKLHDPGNERLRCCLVQLKHVPFECLDFSAKLVGVRVELYRELVNGFQLQFSLCVTGLQS